MVAQKNALVAMVNHEKMMIGGTLYMYYSYVQFLSTTMEKEVINKHEIMMVSVQ
jgi:hypothetical protein